MSKTTIDTAKLPIVYVIIPAYNEEQVLLETLSQVRTIQKSAHACEIYTLVVDNSSTDQTYQVARQCADVAVRENRRGYGQAVHTGILEAKRRSADIVVVLDADGSDAPKNIISVIEPLLNDEVDFCLGQRMKFAEDGSLTTLQRYGNRFACLLMCLVIERKYRDLGSLRAISMPAFEKLEMDDGNFGWNIEMQIKAVQKGLRISEIDVTYQERRGGESKISGNMVQAIKAGSIIVSSVLKYGFLKR